MSTRDISSSEIIKEALKTLPKEKHDEFLSELIDRLEGKLEKLEEGVNLES